MSYNTQSAVPVAYHGCVLLLLRDASNLIKFVKNVFHDRLWIHSSSSTIYLRACSSHPVMKYLSTFCTISEQCQKLK